MFICLDNKVKQYNLNYKKNILKYIWNILKYTIPLLYKHKKMKYNLDTTQRWKLSKIRELADNDCLINLPHQRLEKPSSKRKGPQELIKAILNEELQNPWVYSDLNSNLEYAKFRNNKDEVKYFENNINHKIKNELLGLSIEKLRLYSIEDSQQRTADLRLIDDSHFENEDQKNFFWDSEVPVFINYNCSLLKLVKIFTRINDGTSLTTDDKLWGYPSVLNEGLKELVLKKDYTTNLYTKKRRDESVRDLYKNLKRILIVCGLYDNININIKTTEKNDVKLFTESETLTIDRYDKIIKIFEKSIDYLKDKKSVKSRLSHQAKVTFILHILSKQKKESTDNIIKETLELFPDTRKRPESWYKDMLEYFNNK